MVNVLLVGLYDMKMFIRIWWQTGQYQKQRLFEKQSETMLSPVKNVYFMDGGRCLSGEGTCPTSIKTQI